MHNPHKNYNIMEHEMYFEKDCDGWELEIRNLKEIAQESRFEGLSVGR